MSSLAQPLTPLDLDSLVTATHRQLMANPYLGLFDRLLDNQISDAILRSMVDFLGFHRYDLDRVVSTPKKNKAEEIISHYSILVGNLFLSNVLSSSQTPVKDIIDLFTSGEDSSPKIQGLLNANIDVALQAAKILPYIPLAVNPFQELELSKRYVKLLVKTMESPNYSRFQQALLDPKRFIYLINFLADGDLVSAHLHPINGIPTSMSGALFVSPEFSISTRRDNEWAIKAYDYFADEKKLLADSVKEIVGEISKRLPRREINLTDLGVGAEKFIHLVRGFRENGYSVNTVTLIDGKESSVNSSASYLQERLGNLPIQKVTSRFENLEDHPLIKSSKGDKPHSLTAYLGTTFCNHEPVHSFQFLRSTGAKYFLIGIYHLPDSDEDIRMMVAGYNTLESAGYVGAICNKFGIAREDMAKTKYQATLESVDWSEAYGNLFKDVKVVVGHYEAQDAISPINGQTGNVRDNPLDYESGSKIGGLRSHKFTRRQFDILLQHHNFGVLKEFQQKDISLYLVEDKTP